MVSGSGSVFYFNKILEKNVILDVKVGVLIFFGGHKTVTKCLISMISVMIEGFG